jgi:hypothetical protein
MRLKLYVWSANVTFAGTLGLTTAATCSAALMETGIIEAHIIANAKKLLFIIVFKIVATTMGVAD